MSEQLVMAMAVVGILLVGFLAGIVVGSRSEREAWTVRAYGEGKSNTPHHCDGEFYYIIPESIFVNEFKRKEVNSEPDRPTSGLASRPECQTEDAKS